MLKKLSHRYGYDFRIFRHNLIRFFLSVFVFSRIFHIISHWNTLKYISKPFEFFIMSDYNFSLFGALVWFFLVLFIYVKLKKESIKKYIDGAVLSFLFTLFLWYIGAFLWGQVYGRETHLGIEILYNSDISNIPYQVAIFPLPLVYAFVFLLLFWALYSLSLFIHIKWFIGYVGLVAFSAIILIFEFFSWKHDILSGNMSLPFNLNQVFALILLGFSIRGLYHLLKDIPWDSKIILSNISSETSEQK